MGFREQVRDTARVQHHSNSSVAKSCAAVFDVERGNSATGHHTAASFIAHREGIMFDRKHSPAVGAHLKVHRSAVIVQRYNKRA